MEKNTFDGPKNMHRFGFLLILLGVAGFITTAVISCINIDMVTNGTMPALSFLIFIIGLVFVFPSLLQESKGDVSTMRVIVLITVLVFAIVYIKLGWIAGNFEEFTIDRSWVYILGLAFGSKAFQRFAEAGDNDAKGDDTDNTDNTNNKTNKPGTDG